MCGVVVVVFQILKIDFGVSARNAHANTVKKHEQRFQSLRTTESASRCHGQSGHES